MQTSGYKFDPLLIRSSLAQFHALLDERERERERNEGRETRGYNAKQKLVKLVRTRLHPTSIDHHRFTGGPTPSTTPGNNTTTSPPKFAFSFATRGSRGRIIPLARSSTRNPGRGRSWPARKERGGRERWTRSKGRVERTEHAQDTRDRSRYDVSRANSPVRGFSLTILDKGALEQGILSIPIEDPVRPRRHWRGQMLACPAPRCALTHTLSLSLTRSFFSLHPPRLHHGSTARLRRGGTAPTLSRPAS